MASGARKFKFISPGVFTNEIDRSQFPAEPTAVGPVIIGRTRQGPGMVPTKVSSFDEFTRIFGSPDPGAEGGDNWRSGDFDGPTYGAYAAQAWLNSGEAPVTFMRLLGAKHRDADSTQGAKAGWNVVGSADSELASNAGAYGLFLVNSSSATEAPTGSLAAVWYVEQGSSIRLTGSMIGFADGTAKTQVSGTAVMIQSQGSNSEFIAEILTSGESNGFNATVSQKVCFNFDRDSEKYIRKVFNTNASQTNSQIVNNSDNPNFYTYFLGETFDQFHTQKVTSTGAGNVYGVILAIQTGSTYVYQDHQKDFQNAETPFFRAQDLGDASGFLLENSPKLFKLVSRNHGEWANRNIKVSIERLRAPAYPNVDPYGTFSVVLRRVTDRDEKPVYLERFDNLNLNPNSENYIARRIGDRYAEWDNDDRRLRHYGTYDNLSPYVRVVMDESVDNGGVSAEALPFGYFGPPRFNRFGFTSASTGPQMPQGTAGTFVSGAGTQAMTIVEGNQVIAHAIQPRIRLGSPDYTLGSDDGVFIAVGGNELGGVVAGYSASFEFPAIRLRISASAGSLTNPTDAYFGIQTTREASSQIFDPSYYDMVRMLPASTDSFTITSGTLSVPGTEHSFAFTMNDLHSGSDGFNYLSGSQRAEKSYTGTSGNTYKSLLDAGFDKFTAPMFGGFDGLNIKEKEPFRNTDVLASKTQINSYAFNTIKRAIDTVADPDAVETNIITAPGIWNSTLTEHLLDVCEERGDALGIIDIEHSYLPPTENTESAVSNRPNVASAVSTLRTRSLNNSYGCCFFPWVQVKDTATGRLVDVPPSVAALGTFGSSQARTELWFAPAGFVRGGLSNGAAGLPVTNVKMRLNSKDRDDLYAANINPIASFPNEGIVIFGQKTLQVTRSALDRINVRRLLIFVKKEVSRIANGILFEPNVQATWDRFTSAVNPFLGDVKARFGLTDFRVVLDSTTTTDDLIDRNILYAKIYLKPARAIEFIALDFIITRTGASFDD